MSAQWLATVQEMQRQTAEAHMHFQRVLGDAHQAFLQMAENTFAAFAAPGAHSPGNGAPAQPVALLPPTQPLALPAPLPSAPVPTPPPPAYAPAPAPTFTSTPVPAPQAPPPPHVSVPMPSTPETPAAAPTQVMSLELLLSVVADKTGYPADMLNGDMDLETDLGIDSIKKVEIFAAVRQNTEGLPPTDSPQMARLFQARTLNEVVRLAADAEDEADAEDLASQDSIADADIDAARSHSADGRGEGAGTGTAPSAILRRLQVTPVAAAACGLAMAGLGHGPLWVVDGGSGLAPAVTAELAARGIAVACDDEPVPGLRGVILLGAMVRDCDPHQAAAVNRAAFQAARSVAAHLDRHGGVFVTVQDTGGCFGLAGADPARAWLGGLAALARTAAREWPRVAVKAIDCQRADRDDAAVAAAIVTELLTGGATLDVGLRADGTRWTLADVEIAPAPAPFSPTIAYPVTADSVLVVTGGARGVTAAALIALAAGHSARMLLIGRTVVETDTEPTDDADLLATAHDQPALTRLLAERNRAGGKAPSAPAQLADRARELLARQEVRATLAALEHAGATARYAAVDVTDRAALERELARVRRDWGPITGLIHGAGVLADRYIADKTDEQFDHVYGTKVAGLQALLDATAADPVELLAVFSSVAARYGNPGQCDYAMANEVLNQVASAERARRPSCRVHAIGWGPWEAGMVTAAHATHFRNLGVALIPLEAGARAFVTEIGTDDGAAQVLMTATAQGDAAMAADRAATAPDRPRFAVEAAIDARSHGFVADHAPSGVPVLPLALAIEWFAAAGRSRHPDRPTALDDIRVLNKVELPNLNDVGHRFTIEGSGAEADPSALDLRLTSSTGTLHYRARLIPPDAAPHRRIAPFAPPAPSAAPGAGVLILNGEAIYQDPVLFHGPGFRALRSIEGISPAGAEAQVVGLRALGWPDRLWWTDPAAIDGALQAAVLWVRRVTGDATLPMGVDALRVHRAGPAAGAARCLVRATASAADQIRCDLALLDPDGQPRAELLGVSLIRRPDMASLPAVGASDAASVGAA
jgi:NADP-dependent 3-hydroxy acid dehydrogenase YdfG